MANLIVAGIIFLIVFYTVFKALLYFFKVNKPEENKSEVVVPLKDTIQQFQEPVVHRENKPNLTPYTTNSDLKRNKKPQTTRRNKKPTKFIDL